MLYQQQFINGLILNMQSSDFLTEKIVHHEKVYSPKVASFYSQFSLNKIQHTPILLGFSSDEFDSILNLCKTDSQPIKLDKNERIWAVDNKNKHLLDRFLHQLPELLLIDGHHRFHALQALNQNICAWIVPFYKLSIGSFIKVFNYQQSENFYQRLEEKFSIMSAKSLAINSPTSQINFYFKNKFYKISVDDSCSFIDLLCNFYSIIMQENLELTYYQKYESDELLNLVKSYSSDHFIVAHSTLKHSELFDSSILLPAHSTCFEPKPTNKSLSLLAQKTLKL